MLNICILGRGFIGARLYKFFLDRLGNKANIESVSVRNGSYLIRQYDIVIDAGDRSYGLHNDKDKHMIKAIRQELLKNSKRYIYLSSIQVYNQKSKVIFEDSNLEVRNEYIENKIRIEQELLKSRNDVIILRLSNIWSEESPIGTFIGDQINKVKNDKPIIISNEDETSYIDLVYIDDVVKLIERFRAKDKINSNLFNISSGFAYNIAELKSYFSNKLELKSFPYQNIVVKYPPLSLIKELAYCPKTFSYHYNKVLHPFLNQ